MNIPGFERFTYRNEKNMNNPKQTYIIVTDKSIILYSFNEGTQYQGENGHTKIVIPSFYPISQEHAKKVFRKFNRGFHIDNLFDEGTMYIVDELLGDLFYNYDETKLSEEFKTMERTEPSMVNHKGDEEKDINPYLSRFYLLKLIQFIKKNSPWIENYTRIRDLLKENEENKLKPVLKKTPRMVPRPRKIFSQPTSEQVLTAGRKTRKYK